VWISPIIQAFVRKGAGVGKIEGWANAQNTLVCDDVHVVGSISNFHRIAVIRVSVQEGFILGVNCDYLREDSKTVVSG
jgi:hypothetical protein